MRSKYTCLWAVALTVAACLPPRDDEPARWVQCYEHTDCPDGGVCSGGGKGGLCEECLEDSDCDEGQRCSNENCSDLEPCETIETCGRTRKIAHENCVDGYCRSLCGAETPCPEGYVCWNDKCLNPSDIDEDCVTGECNGCWYTGSYDTQRVECGD